MKRSSAIPVSALLVAGAAFAEERDGRVSWLAEHAVAVRSIAPAEYYEKPGERRYNRDLPRRLVSVIDQRRRDLLVRASPREIDRIRQSLVSLPNMDRALGGQAGTGRSEDGYTRDTAMAENLLWLLDGPLKGRKVIVWAHNDHVLRDLQSSGAAEILDQQGKPTR